MGQRDPTDRAQGRRKNRQILLAETTYAYLAYLKIKIRLSNLYLEDLFTIEAARGKGVGRALIEEVYRLAKQARSAEVCWQTHETNTTAMKLYDKVAQKFGFLVYQKTL